MRRQFDLATEDEIIRIPACDLTAATERFKRTLIGRVLHRGGRSVEAMIALLPRAPNLGNGRFKFDFDKEEDLLMVLNKRPCHFNHWIFALERWEPSTSENFPNTVPFWIKITGVPVHLWNDGTFSEIAKALGKREDIDAENARIRVSVDADKPLKMEARVEFPNGEVGKVHMTYEGLNRHCFECKRISHDIHSCPALSPEEREQKIKELRELNISEPETTMHQALAGTAGHSRRRAPNNKRPRSPNGETDHRSPTRVTYPGQSREGKRQKESGNYWTSKAHLNREAPGKGLEKERGEKERRFSNHQGKATVWNRLDGHREGRYGARERRSPTGNSTRLRQSSTERPRRREPYRTRERYYSHQSQASQQAWRPRVLSKEGKSCSPSRTVTNSKFQRTPPAEKEDSQQTISGGLKEYNGQGGQGNGVLVVHTNETSEERWRRLKGKAVMLEEPSDNTSPPRNRGTILIREGGIRSPPPAPRSVISPLRLRDEPEEPSLELDTLMRSKHIDSMVLTREEEADVDKLVNDFGGVVMDDAMLQNDDLLGDEPGYDAEVIDAISNLSPANAVNKEKGAQPAVTTKSSQPMVTYQKKNKIAGLSKSLHTGSGQGRTSDPEEKKRSSQGQEQKGVQASKKLNALRGRPSPREKSSGNQKKSNSLAVPRSEVFLSAKSRNLSFVSGSVGSQKPPNKKI
ncbi:hypothetical protein Bca52824_096632 [Brassica carinata]|uniref:DUF4283 domain-containing protein n=1 Tax=Brassica carinata TaxID=52824 RepID=A0A8X7NZM8_BRACI|nr:hypothetical protein Bca52824_096632 [Brassica carinata]